MFSENIPLWPQLIFYDNTFFQSLALAVVSISRNSSILSATTLQPSFNWGRINLIGKNM